jgi:hypothetical protein
MPVTVTTTTKPSTVSLTLQGKPAGQDIAQGTPIGLLLALTYPSAIAGAGALTVTLISKP